uniref:CUB domain-containing protein n=1 Tax=Tetranychus urticae TaxID=32264 RepID=T1KI07_TETUR
MDKLKQIYLFIVIISIPTSQSSTNCNDNCLTTTYYLSTDGTNECPSEEQCAARVSFKPSQVNGENYLTIDLVGYKVNMESVSLLLTADGIENVYSCKMISILGDTDASVTIEGKAFRNGSSVYLDGNLLCSWTMSIKDQVWPHFKGQPIDLISDDKFSIVLERNDISLIVSPLTDQLTISRMKFLKCCHRVYGNDQYQLVVVPTRHSTTLQIQSIRLKPIVFTLNLVSPNGELIFDCFPQSNLLMAYAKIDRVLYSMADQLLSQRVNPPFICSWSLPLTFKGSTGLNYQVTEQVYGAKIYADSQIVYSNDYIQLTSFSFQSISPSSTLIFVTLFIVNNII